MSLREPYPPWAGDHRMLPIEEIDFGKAVDELFAPTDARKQADLNKTARNTDPQCAGIDLGALAAGRAGLAQWPQSVLPVGGRV